MSTQPAKFNFSPLLLRSLLLRIERMDFSAAVLNISHRQGEYVRRQVAIESRYWPLSAAAAEESEADISTVAKLLARKQYELASWRRLRRLKTVDNAMQRTIRRLGRQHALFMPLVRFASSSPFAVAIYGEAVHCQIDLTVGAK